MSDECIGFKYKEILYKDTLFPEKNLQFLILIVVCGSELEKQITGKRINSKNDEYL